MTIDPRRERTRNLLTAALIRLLSERGLTAVTVADLCAEAGVHRTTFYNHADGIEAFATDVVARDLDDVATVGADWPGTRAEYGQAMIAVLDHVTSRRSLYRALLESTWSGVLRGVLTERMENRVVIALDAFANYPDVDIPTHRDEVVAVVAGGLVGGILLWARSDDTDSAARARRIQELMPPWWPVR